MNRVARIAFGSVIVSGMLFPARAGEDAEALRAIHERCGGSVVAIDVVIRKQLDNGVDVDLESQALGVVVGEGLVMTPSHPFAESDGLESSVAAIAVRRAGGMIYEGELVGVDAASRLAFVRVAHHSFDVAPLAFATDDALAVGDFVATLKLAGPSFRDVPYVDAFMVNAKLESPRYYVASHVIGDYLGSPVVALDGRVVGIVNFASLLARAPKLDPVTGQRALDVFVDVQGHDGDGVELVIVPASRFAAVLADPPIRKPGAPQAAAPQRAWLGVEAQPLLPELAVAMELPHDATGVVLTRVLRDSPAARAGMAPGDVLTGFGDVAIAADAPGEEKVLAAAVAARSVGDRVAIAYQRGGVPRQAEVSLDAAPLAPAAAAKARIEAFGIAARDLVLMDRADLDLDDSVAGARVTVVKRAGFCGIAGLRVGDIVTKVDGEPIADAGDLAEKLALVQRTAATSLQLFVVRGAETLFIDVRPEWAAH
jgi:S1-C subfamily serine protease